MDKFTLPKSGAAVGDFGYDLPHTMDGLHHAIKEALDLIVEMQGTVLRMKELLPQEWEEHNWSGDKIKLSWEECLAGSLLLRAINDSIDLLPPSTEGSSNE